ncbi:MAG: alanine--glyoxylate aminotransferase family protein [Phycisphaeraceae bacterium]|nr:alanine--glyoxylate aminotransferase family protein [Phycisphaeraceae bacterium]
MSQVPVFYRQRLLTPGPTQVPEAVLLEMAQPIIHHRTKQFQAIFAELSQRLSRVFRTKNPVLTITGSGTTAFEAAQVSLVKPGSRVLTISCGKFGERWQDIYDRYAPVLDIKENVKLDVPWGQAPTAAQVEQILKDKPDISVVTIVHSETSTATACDLKAIAAVVGKSNALLIADGITSVGAMPVEMDGWGVDVLVTGSQKAMMLPPGLGYVGLGERALARLEEVPVRGAYNLDLRAWLKGWKKNDVPFTPGVSLIRGQRVALEMIENAGLETVWARTRKLADATRAAMAAMGLKPISQSPSDSVSGAFYPEGVEDSKFRAALRDKHGVHIAGGQDGRGAKWKSSIMRVSSMGYVDAGDILVAMAAIEAELITCGCKIAPGSALAAAGKVLGA